MQLHFRSAITVHIVGITNKRPLHKWKLHHENNDRLSVLSLKFALKAFYIHKNKPCGLFLKHCVRAVVLKLIWNLYVGKSPETDQDILVCSDWMNSTLSPPSNGTNLFRTTFPQCNAFRQALIYKWRHLGYYLLFIFLNVKT